MVVRERETNCQRQMQKQTSLFVYRAAGCWTERKVEREKQTQTVRDRCRGAATDRPTCLLSSRLLERQKGGERERNKHRLSVTEAEVDRLTSLPVYRAASCWRERKVDREKQIVRDRGRGTETDRPTCLLGSRLLEREKGGESETNTDCQSQRQRQISPPVY